MTTSVLADQRPPGPDLPGDPESVVRTIAFTDIVGSTSFAERCGDHALYELLELHDRLVHSITANWRGTVVKSVGDGSMLSFLDASDAIAAAIQTQRRAISVGLQLRVGADHGDILVCDDGDYRGLVANVASRLTAMASVGEVVLSERVARAACLRGAFHVRKVRGMTARQRVRTVTVKKAAL